MSITGEIRERDRMIRAFVSELVRWLNEQGYVATADFSIDDPYRICAKLRAEDDWEGNIAGDRFFAAIEHGETTIEGVRATIKSLIERSASMSKMADMTWDEVKDSIMPKLEPMTRQMSAGGMKVYSRFWLGDLSLFYVLDDPQFMRFVLESQPAQWGVTIEQIHETAMANLRAKTPADCWSPGWLGPQPGPDTAIPMMYFALQQIEEEQFHGAPAVEANMGILADPYTGTRLLMLDQLTAALREAHPDGPLPEFIFIAPDRNTLLGIPRPPDDRPVALEGIKGVARMMAKGPYSLSKHVYAIDATGAIISLGGLEPRMSMTPSA